jgi:hypothetical protein
VSRVWVSRVWVSLMCVTCVGVTCVGVTNEVRTTQASELFADLVTEREVGCLFKQQTVPYRV